MTGRASLRDARSLIGGWMWDGLARFLCRISFHCWLPVLDEVGRETPHEMCCRCLEVR